MTLVLDSSAIIAYMKQEPGGPLVAELMEIDKCYVHAVNLCEVYYGLMRELGEPSAKSVLADIADLGVKIREDMDSEFWQEAGRYKADLHRISLADCFCLSLANRLQAEVVTADHHEFDTVKRRQLGIVRFIR